MMENISRLVSAGNWKLPNTTAIFNMGEARTCPSSKLGLCQAYVKGKCVCYARKAEIQYWTIVPFYRQRQERYWKAVTAEQFTSELLAFNKRKRNKFTALRLNEAGDFWSQVCVDKAEKIAGILSKYKIKTYSYSARRDLDFSKCKYLVVSGSGFKTSGMKGIFTMVTDLKDKPKGWGTCCGHCGVWGGKGCKRCLVGSKTVILKH